VNVNSLIVFVNESTLQNMVRSTDNSLTVDVNIKQEAVLLRTKKYQKLQFVQNTLSMTFHLKIDNNFEEKIVSVSSPSSLLYFVFTNSLFLCSMNIQIKCYFACHKNVCSVIWFICQFAQNVTQKIGQVQLHHSSWIPTWRKSENNYETWQIYLNIIIIVTNLFKYNNNSKRL